MSNKVVYEKLQDDTRSVSRYGSPPIVNLLPYSIRNTEFINSSNVRNKNNTSQSFTKPP